MPNETLVTAALAEFGYARLKRLVYKASWSVHEIEHFLFFSLYGKPKVFLTSDFGVRNTGAQAFGTRSVEAYGGEVYRCIGQEEREQCYMRFPLGKLAGWKPRWSLAVPSMSDEDLVATIKEAVGNRLFPVIRDVTNIGRLLTLLVSDEEPVRWLHVNGAMRAAQIVYLARDLGLTANEIRLMLKPREGEIGEHLARAKIDPASYIDQVIQDSETVLLASNEKPKRWVM
jgi:hypothetical protein